MPEQLHQTSTYLILVQSATLTWMTRSLNYPQKCWYQKKAFIWRSHVAQLTCNNAVYLIAVTLRVLNFAYMDSKGHHSNLLIIRWNYPLLNKSVPGQRLGQRSDLLTGFLTFLPFIHFTCSYKFFSEHVDVVLMLSNLVFARYTARIVPRFLAVLSQILYDFRHSVCECCHWAVNAATVPAYQNLACWHSVIIFLYYRLCIFSAVETVSLRIKGKITNKFLAHLNSFCSTNDTNLPKGNI
jgi:hypothetical protein